MGNKVTVDDITNVGHGSGVPTINENFDTVADEFDKVLYRDGSQSATGDIDMDSNRILNLPAGISPLEPLRRQDITDAGGVIGPAGQSAYNLAVENGFSGTVSEWLDSLVGPEGPQGPPGADGADGAGGGGVASPPRSHSIFIGSITGNTLTVPKDFELHLTPRMSYGVPEVGMELVTLQAGVTLPEGLTITGVTSAYAPETAPDVGGTTGVYTVSETLESPTPSVVYFQGYREVETGTYGVTQVGPTKVELRQWGVTGQNDADDVEKIKKAFREYPIGGEFHLNAGNYYVDETLVVDRDVHITAEPGTSLQLRTAAGNYIPLIKVDPKYRRVGEANLSRGFRIVGNHAVFGITNTSTGANADEAGDAGGSTLRKAGGYVIDVNPDFADADGQGVMRMMIDGLRLTGGNQGAIRLIGGPNGSHETYWCVIQNCPAIEGRIFDGGSDGNCIQHNNFLGSYQTAIVMDKQEGALNQLITHNTSSCRNGFLNVVNGTVFEVSDNQLEHAGATQNANDSGAQIAILAQDYVCNNPKFLRNNFGKASYDTTGVALLGETVGATFQGNMWNLYTLDATQRSDIVIGHVDVREMVWYPDNQFRGDRESAAGGTTGEPNRRAAGEYTDPTRFLRIAFANGVGWNDLKAATGLEIPIHLRTGVFLGGTTSPVTGVYLLRDFAGRWHMRGDLATVPASGDFMQLPDWARANFQQNVLIESNGALVPRPVTTTGVLAGGAAFGAATAKLEHVSYQGRSHHDYILEV